MTKMMMMNDNDSMKFMPPPLSQHSGGVRNVATAAVVAPNNGEFIKKPGKGWLHSDESIQEGITYTVKYVGFIGVKESMKSLSFDVRTQVARESIRRVAESAKCINLSRRSTRSTNDDQVNRILSNACVTQWSGMNVQLHINTQVLKVTQLECNDTLFQHTMQNISFACGGDSEIQDFIAYVAKDDVNGRACYVFECGNNLANSVITTVGQAFELRFKKFLNSMPTAKPNKSPTHSNNSGSVSGGLEKPVIPTSQQHHHHQVPTTKQLTNNVNTALSPSRQPAPKAAAAAPPTTTSNQHHMNNHHTTTSNNNHHNHHHHHHQYPMPPPPPPPSSSSQNIRSNGTSATTTTNAAAAAAAIRIDESLEKMPWFHGLMSRDQAEKLLTRDGHYLVRETNKTAEKQYVLSGRYKGECRHIFLVDPSGVIRTKDRVFDNICHLIQYHQENKIPIISKENELLLEYPVCR